MNKKNIEAVKPELYVYKDSETKPETVVKPEPVVKPKPIFQVLKDKKVIFEGAKTNCLMLASQTIGIDYRAVQPKP